MTHNALLVGADDNTTEGLSNELHPRGWQTTSCPGPSSTSRCPLLVGGRCDLRENADTAVVFVDTSKVAASGVIPKLRCAADRSSPYVLVLQGSLEALQDRAGGAVIGSRRGAEAIADAVEHVARLKPAFEPDRSGG